MNFEERLTDWGAVNSAEQGKGMIDSLLLKSFIT